MGRKRDIRFFGLEWKGSNSVNLLLYILIDLLRIKPFDQFRNNGGTTLTGRCIHLFNAFYSGDRVLYGQDNSLFNLLGTGPGIGHIDTDLIQGKIRKHLLLDFSRHIKPTQKKNNHQ